MISVLPEVHTALQSNARQHVALSFVDSGILFTDGDVVLESNVNISSMFCSEEDLTYGLTPSAEITFSLFNDNRELDEFNFGQFKAYFGATIDTGTRTTDANVIALRNDNYKTKQTAFSRYSKTFTEYTGHLEAPYLRVNGAATDVQPKFPVYSIFVRDGEYIICYGIAGEVFICTLDGKTDMTAKAAETWQTQKSKTWNTEKERTWADLLGVYLLEGFEKSQAIRYAEKRLGVWAYPETGLCTICYEDNFYEVCQFVQKGEYWATRPTKVRTSALSIIGYDAMVAKLGVSANGFEVPNNPTIGSIFNSLISYAGIETVTNPVPSFIKDQKVDLIPGVLTDMTVREVLGFLAGAMLQNARFNNEGKLELFALNMTPVMTLTEANYSSFAPVIYEVKKADVLQIRHSENDIGVHYGTGTNPYIIQENPFLTYDSESTGTTLAKKLYENLASVDYVPSTLSWFGDWTVEPGDCIKVTQYEDEFLMPIFTMNLRWNGKVIQECECTGSEYRDPFDFKTRETFRTNRKMAEFIRTVDEMMVTYSDLDDLNQELSAKITVNAQNIDLKVAKGDIIAQINASAEKVTINANRIQIGTFEYGQAGSNVDIPNSFYTGGKVGSSGTATGFGASNSDYAFWAGGGKFRVAQNGALYAENASLKGELKAGNWWFDKNGLGYYKNGDYTQYPDFWVTTDGGGRSDYGEVRILSKYNLSLETFNNSATESGILLHPTSIDLKPSYSSYDWLEIFIGSTGDGRSVGDGEILIENRGSSGTSHYGYVGTPQRPFYGMVAQQFITPSSRKVKEDITAMSDTEGILKKLEPVSFHYIGNEKKRFGLILEDTIEVLPEICSQIADGTGSINYTDLIPFLLKGIQGIYERLEKGGL